MHSVALEISRTISNIQPTTIDTGIMELKENVISKRESEHEPERLLLSHQWLVGGERRPN